MSNPVKYPKLSVTTAYFQRDGSTKRLYSADPVRALMLATGHLALDHYGAETVQIYDSDDGTLFWEIVKVAHGTETTYKCDPKHLDDPMRKKRRSADFLFTQA